MFVVIERTFAPDNNQLGSEDLAEFNTEADANAYIAILSYLHGDPNPDEPRSQWHVEAV